MKVRGFCCGREPEVVVMHALFCCPPWTNMRKVLNIDPQKPDMWFCSVLDLHEQLVDTTLLVAWRAWHEMMGTNALMNDPKQLR
jgi:hypothetical protein